eukprot:711333_1
MARLFHYLPQNFAYFDISLFTFCLLLDINLTQLNRSIQRNLKEYIRYIFDTDEWDALLDNLGLIIKKRNRSMTLNDLSRIKAQSVAQMIKTTYQQGVLLKYMNTHVFTLYMEQRNDIDHVLNTLAVRKLANEQRNDLDLDYTDLCDQLANALYSSVKLSKERMYYHYIQQKCQHDCFSAFQNAAQQWVNPDCKDSNSIPIETLCPKRQVLRYTDNEATIVATFLFDILEMQSPEQNTEIQEIEQALKAKLNRTLQDELLMDLDLFVKQKMLQSFDFYVEQAGVKLNMPSVKQMKAIWYQGINEDHNVFPGDVISKPHVTALVSYTNNTGLCAEFRGTYRAMKAGEDITSKKTRHSYFAHFGRLLYESYVFYASIKSQVRILYHGMSQQMIFSSLQCAFDQPTSTTTAQSIATSFSHGTGMVLSFENCESCQFIRALDMSLFSCFDTEEEHLIFEARLRIKDIFIPKDRKWVGKCWMKALTLYDLLIHGNRIYEKHLLKSKNQSLLVFF